VDPDTRIDDSSIWIRVRIRILKIKLSVEISGGMYHIYSVLRILDV
jgi:hypothetical protein